MTDCLKRELNHEERRHLKLLRRRIDWLDRRMEAEFSYDKAEKAALLFVLDYIEEVEKSKCQEK